MSEELLRHHGGQLRGRTEPPMSRVDDDAATRAPNGLEQRVEVQGRQAPQVQDLHVDVRRGQTFCGSEREPDHARHRDHCHVAAGTSYGGLTQWYDVLPGRDLPDGPVAELVLEEEDGVVVAYRRLQQSLGIGGV
jgi:hypothetical protein